MADINNITLSAGSSPTVNYTITYTKIRPSNSQMTYNFTISAALGSSGSYINAGYALMCTMTVNGIASQVRIKANDNDNWSGTTPRLKTVSVTCASTTGNATQNVRFQVVSDGLLTLSSGVIDNSGYTVLSSPLLYTACGAPASCSVGSTVSEGNVTLSWSGASSGTNNAISSYEIQYRDSSDNSSWGSWTVLTSVATTATSGSVSVAPPSIRGNYRQFQVRTRGAAGSSYYSGWKVSTNTLRKAILPTAPTTCSVNTTVSESNVTLSWSGAASGAGHSIASYEIQYSDSTDNSTWGSWTALTTITTTATSGSTSVAPPSTRGSYRRFQVRARSVEGTGYTSGWKVSSNSVRKAALPTAPTACSVNSTLSEGNVTLSWSGAAAGTGGHAIASYEIKYCESSDNATWGSWAALTSVTTTATSGSASVAPPSTRGNYRRFQVRTVSAVGASYYSAWKVSTNTVRKATLPTSPSTCSVNATLSEGNVTLSWSGAANGSGHNIASYEIQYSESTNNSTWGVWTALSILTTTVTSGSLSVAPPATRGSYRRFQVRAVPSGGSAYASPWKISSNSVRRNTLPGAPTAVTASPSVYNNENITLTWSGAAAGTSAIKGFRLSYSSATTDGSVGANWYTIATIDLSATSGSYTWSGITRTPGQYTTLAVTTIDALDVASDRKIGNTVYCAITACGAPTACSASSTLSEGNVTLSWSGATSGAGNAISSYEIQYSESSNGSSWGTWTVLTTVNSTATSGSLSVAPSGTRGNYRRFQVRARGAAGTSYYSSWKVSTNNVRKNTLPTAPATFTASPNIYAASDVTLLWSGAVAGTSSIKQYVIKQCTSVDNSTWSAYSTLATITGSATSGSYMATASNVAGTYTCYRISVTDALDAVSGYTVSNAVKRNSPPPALTVTAPVNGSSTYNPNPRFLIKTGIEPDGQTQIAAVRIGSGAWQDSVNNKALFSVNGYLNNNTALIFRPGTQTAGAKTVTFRCLDNGIEASSAEVSRNINILPSPFETITANVTHVKANHITALRTAVNTVRAYYGMAAILWKEDISAGKTEIKNWPFHILELRRAIEPVISFINSFDTVTAFDVPAVTWLPIGNGRPRADVMLQIQNLLLAL